MKEVDLSLAVSYVPAGVCLLKLTSLFFLLWCASNQEHKWYAIIAMGLWLDRHYQSDFSIVDTNNMLLSVYAAHVINLLRDFGPMVRDHISILETCFAIVWCISCAYSVSHYLQLVPVVRAFKNAHIRVENTLLCVSCIMFFSCARESLWVSFGRTFIFAVFCLFWRYAVDLRNLRSSAAGKIQAPISVLFMPILYVFPLLTVVYSLCCCTLICLRFVNFPSTTHAELHGVQRKMDELVIETMETNDDSQEMLEKMLREAKALKSNGGI